MTTTINNKPAKCVCNICGKNENCIYRATEMAFCPTYIRPRIDRKKTLTASPFKVLSKLHISTRK